MDCLGPGCNVFRFSYMESILLVMWKHFNNCWDTCFLEACVSDFHTMSLTLSLAWMCCNHFSYMNWCDLVFGSKRKHLFACLLTVVFSCECTLVWNLVSLKLAVQFTCITLYELHSYYTRLEPVFLKFSVECTHAWSLVSLKLVV